MVDEHVECDECRQKPGSPVLCRPCQLNRGTILNLIRERDAARDANRRAHEWSERITKQRDEAWAEGKVLRAELRVAEETIRIQRRKIGSHQKERDEARAEVARLRAHVKGCCRCGLSGWPGCKHCTVLGAQSEGAGS